MHGVHFHYFTIITYITVSVGGRAGTFADVHVATFSLSELTNCFCVTLTGFSCTFRPHTAVLYKHRTAVYSNPRICGRAAEFDASFGGRAETFNVRICRDFSVMRIKKLLTNSSSIHET